MLPNLSPRGLLLLCLQLALTVIASGGAFDSKDVLRLTTKNFEEEVSGERIVAVKFYAPWCGHCKRLAPTWKELAAAYKTNNNVQIAHIDCTKNATVCKQAQVGGYPKLVLFYNGKQHATYRGPRDLEHLRNFIDEAVKELTLETEL